jgi:putative CocE/NonD family hydrolase
VPGTGRSEGTWEPVSRAEGEALHDVIEWVARQPWCTGRIGMIGQSYFCWTTWNVARTRPPHLTTIVAFDGATDMYRDWMYHGGIPCVFPLILGFAVTMNHQENGQDFYGGLRYRAYLDAFAHRFDDEWHRRRSPFWELDQVDIPVLSIGLWGKANLHLRGNVLGYERVRGPKQLLIDDAPTFPAAQQLFGDAAYHEREILPWYDYHLKGVQNRVMDRPAIRYFVEREGRYRSAGTWPPEDVGPATFYLTGARSGVVQSLNDGSLDSRAPTAAAASFSWSYPDPLWLAGTTTFDANGVPDHTARVCTFTSAPFADDAEFTGDGLLVLHASTDQRDFDVFARVSVLAPGGHDGALRARRVTQGWLRASHRAEDPALTRAMRPFYTHDHAEPVEPGQPYELRLELLPMSFLVRQGERLRLELSNHDSQVLEGAMAHYYGYKCGTDTYHYDRARPSRLVLPRRPRES